MEITLRQEAVTDRRAVEELVDVYKRQGLFGNLNCSQFFPLLFQRSVLQ